MDQAVRRWRLLKSAYDIDLVRFTVRWLIIPGVGTSLVSLFPVPTIHHRYDDHGVGEYDGIQRGWLATQSTQHWQQQGPTDRSC